jgi:hypothetical protein
MIAARLGHTSPGVSIAGRLNGIGQSFLAGAMRSRQRRMAARFPLLPSSTALRVIVSASPSSKFSTATVVLLRAPFGRPDGLPLWPGSNGLPTRCFCACFFQRCIPWPLVVCLKLSFPLVSHSPRSSLLTPFRGTIDLVLASGEADCRRRAAVHELPHNQRDATAIAFHSPLQPHGLGPSFTRRSAVLPV